MLSFKMAIHQVRPKRRKPRPLQLSFSERGKHGGRRHNCGRRRIPRENRGYVPHIGRPKVTKSTPVHATLRCVAGVPSLRRKSHQRIIEGIFARESRKGFRLVHYSIQGNHLHLICEGDSTEALSRGIQRVASRIARTLNKRWQRRGKLFRERFDGSVIKTPKQMRAALRYVLLNHHKHCLESQHELLEGLDPFSSSRFFDGWRDRRIHTQRPPPGAPVVRPKAWLITTGWRRHGLLRVAWV